MHARLRVQWAAGLPCALISLGGIVSQNSDASCREIAEARFKLARLAGPMRDNPGELFAMQAFPITAKTLYGAFDFAIGQGE
jgi:hypothetical protein